MLQNINSSFDLSCTFGYITLLNISSQIHAKTHTYMISRTSMDMLEQASDIGHLQKDDTNSSQGASETGSSLSHSNEQNPSSWMPLQLCYGIPLFDLELNESVTKKVS